VTKTRRQPDPAPFPVGVEVQYMGPDEADWTDGSMHLLDVSTGTVGLVVENFPGIPGRDPGTFGPDDRGLEAMHGYSTVAYLCLVPVRVAAQTAPGGWVRSADHFVNLEPEGVLAEVAERRLAGYREPAPGWPVDIEAER
jgi:hypothetical protein